MLVLALKMSASDYWSGKYLEDSYLNYDSYSSVMLTLSSQSAAIPF